MIIFNSSIRKKMQPELIYVTGTWLNTQELSVYVSKVKDNQPVLEHYLIYSCFDVIQYRLLQYSKIGRYRPEDSVSFPVWEEKKDEV